MNVSEIWVKFSATPALNLVVVLCLAGSLIPTEAGGLRGGAAEALGGWSPLSVLP